VKKKKKKGRVVVVGGGGSGVRSFSFIYLFYSASLAFTVPDFRNKSQWMERSEKVKGRQLWCSVPWVGFFFSH